MAEQISVHDNELLSYTVNCAESKITLRTAYRDREPYEYTEVLFSGVVAYHFESDNFSTLLFDIIEETVEAIYAEYKELFEARKNYGWPAVDYNTEQDLLAKLREQDIRGFSISSSYGMTGFVLASEMQRAPGTARSS